MFSAAAVLLASIVAVPAGGPPRHVLLLYSYEREFASEAFAKRFRADLTRESSAPIDFIEVALQPTPTSKREPDEVIVEDLRSTFDGRHLDLVVPMGGPAVTFAQRHKDELFPSAPVLLASVDHRFVRSEALPANATAVTVRNDPPRMIESILHLLPDTRTVVVVIGASPHESFWLKEVRTAFQRFDGRLTFIWTNDWSYDELLHHCASLPPHTAIFYGLLLLDGNGVPQKEEQTLADLHGTANAPIFGLFSPQLGHGIVGGPLMSYEDLSRDTSAVAVRLLNGEPARAIPTQTLSAGASMFDARELRRWSIAEGRLQAGSIVRFREPGPSKPWAGAAAVGIAIGVMLTFTAMLASPRTRGRERSTGSQRDGGSEALARLSQRLMHTHEEERASLAKWIEDDVCQKLASLSMDLHARGEADLRDHVSDLARASLTLADPIYAKLSLLGLVATARAFVEQRCARANVALEFTSSDVPEHLPRELSIPLFRVLEHAVDNALRHSKTRELAVSLRRARNILALDVVDAGIGFDPAVVPPAESLGLVAMRERLQPVGGACLIESQPGSGTRVRAFARLTSDLAS
ncbi:MAG TPA: ATP-binding protein [Vicinamibacterales bacterium]|nr:ATP-binding protein [Vicinamibacterales bacterium]